MLGAGAVRVAVKWGSRLCMWETLVRSSSLEDNDEEEGAIASSKYVSIASTWCRRAVVFAETQ